MKHEEMNWKSHDGTDLFAQVWEPDVVNPRAVVCLVHGVGEHSNRYAHVAEAFTKEGFVLFGFDQRGHGRSGGARGHINSIDDFMNDINLLLQQARLRFPGLPLLLYGHSLGGILVLHFTLKNNPDVKGVIATSPGLHTALEKQTFKIFLANVLGSLIPTVALPSGLDSSLISRDPSIVDKYSKDPLVHDKLSLGFGKIMLGVIKWTLENAGSFPLPLLLLHGKKDQIAYPSSSTDFAAALKDRCTLVLWEEGFHELHNEPEKAEVFKTMTMWMDARLREG
ncbi:MAG: lysophospholipase [Anaerolineales bacterium]|nr:lysophospholipase [Anaerolineales bacterium]MCB9146614.1 lysophospholipase [Anaerolineales bacterium]